MFALCMLGTFAVLQQLFGGTGSLFGNSETAAIVVSNSEDDGAGSLREALFSAARLDRRARIVLRIPSVQLETPLPVIFNPRGVVLTSAGAPVVIDASGLSEGAALEVAAPESILRGIHVRGAREAAIVARGPGLLVEDVEISDAGDGLVVGDAAVGLVIRRTRFARNAVGVRVLASAPQVEISDNHFEDHSDAAVWAVRGADAGGADARALVIRSNLSSRDRFGFVLGNSSARVTQNQIVGFIEAGVLLLGSDAWLEDNRVRNGEGIGIHIDASPGAVVRRNEVDHNAVAGVLVRAADGVELSDNRLHSNGYGIISVFGRTADPVQITQNLLLRNLHDGIVVIGGSPLIRGNRGMGNQKAGLRIVDFVRLGGARVPSAPFLEQNVWDGNQLDEPVREDWFEEATT